MFFGTFQKVIAALPGTPWFIRKQNLTTLRQATGVAFDIATETLGQGLRLSQPLRCDASALPHLSLDRKIRIYPTEPEPSKRERLSKHYPIRKAFGSHRGELMNLQPYWLPGAIPTMRIVHQSGAAPGGDPIATWHTLTADGVYSKHTADPSNFDFDGIWQRWSRAWLIIEMHSIGITTTEALWNDGTNAWDGGGAYWDGVQAPNGLMTIEHYDDIRFAVEEAMAAHAVLWGVILNFSPSILQPTGSPGAYGQPDGTWGQLVNSATGIPTRPNECSFVYDRGQAPAVV